LTSAMHPCS